MHSFAHVTNISHSDHQEDFHDFIFTKLTNCFWKLNEVVRNLFVFMNVSKVMKIGMNFIDLILNDIILIQ